MKCPKVGDLVELHDKNYYWLVEVLSVANYQYRVSYLIDTRNLDDVGIVVYLSQLSFDKYNGRILNQDPLP
jgi:hypothetical protein